jgi:hypothetical protein
MLMTKEEALAETNRIIEELTQAAMETEAAILATGFVDAATWKLISSFISTSIDLNAIKRHRLSMLEPPLTPEDMDELMKDLPPLKF